MSLILKCNYPNILKVTNSSYIHSYRGLDPSMLSNSCPVTYINTTASNDCYCDATLLVFICYTCQPHTFIFLCLIFYSYVQLPFHCEIWVPSCHPSFLEDRSQPWVFMFVIFLYLYHQHLCDASEQHMILMAQCTGLRGLWKSGSSECSVCTIQFRGVMRMAWNIIGWAMRGACFGINHL